MHKYTCIKYTEQTHTHTHIISHTQVCLFTHCSKSFQTLSQMSTIGILCQAWSPHIQRNITLLENVQRRAINLVRRLKNKDYETRLKDLELTKLEDRRKIGNMILAYRVINCLVGIDYQNLFSLVNTR
ncbi:unnamed protein product, partial [Meganyctiphanes norvegica]